MIEDTLLPFDLPAVSHKRMTADFAGGWISSDGGLVLLRLAEPRLSLAEARAGCIREWREPARTVHTLPAMPQFRMSAIAFGYEDADDCDALRDDPLFKLSIARAPESGRDLCSHPTMNRLKNVLSRIEVARVTAVLVDLFCRSFLFPPVAITLATVEPVVGVTGGQLAGEFAMNAALVGSLQLFAVTQQMRAVGVGVGVVAGSGSVTGVFALRSCDERHRLPTIFPS